MTTKPLYDHIHRATTLLKALANEKRLQILGHLMEGERSVGELERMVDLSQSALSQHLARLRRDRLVRTRRHAQTIYYSLNGNEAVAIIEELSSLYGNSLPLAMPSDLHGGAHSHSIPCAANSQ
jgi:ArsR family transcriptional regulator, virulence genes transcriptional regulator